MMKQTQQVDKMQEAKKLEEQILKTKQELSKKPEIQATETTEQDLSKDTASLIDSVIKGDSVSGKSSGHLKDQMDLSQRSLRALLKKQEQLSKSFEEIQKQEPALKQERQALEQTLQKQQAQRKAIGAQYQKLLDQLAEEEKRQQEERQRKELEARKQEESKFEEALKESKKTTEKAYALKKKEIELKQTKDNIEQSLKDLKPAIENIKAHLKYIQEQQALVQTETNKKTFQNLYKEDLKKARAEWEQDQAVKEQKREKMQLTCSPNKVRYYNCLADNTQKVKYFNYEYDMDQEKCVEKVQEKQQTCQVVPPKQSSSLAQANTEYEIQKDESKQDVQGLSQVQSKEQSASKQDIDSINQHMSKIDTKVDRLSNDVKNLQTDLNESHNVQQVQVENQQESLVDGSDPQNQKKIVRFA